MSDRFGEMQVFVRVAETGSFSRTGRELGLPQPTVSRIIAGLEARLGAKLLLRTTRRVTPTEAGAVLLARAGALLADLEEVERAVRGTGSLAGVLRVATPVTFGAREIAPALGPFLDAHPALRVELLMSDRIVDLVEEGVDLAVRFGALTDSSFASRRLATAPRHVVASPAYLERRGTPAAPGDLVGHDAILAHAPGAGVWAFTGADSLEAPVPVTARLVATSTEGVLAAAVAGLGVAVLSRFACRAELERGQLRPLLAGYVLAPVDIHAVLPAGRNPPAKTRAFMDHLAAGLARAASP